MKSKHWDFYEGLGRALRPFVKQMMVEEGALNKNMWSHGKVASISADGKRADVYLNAATIATTAVPLVPQIVGTLAVGDEVVVLNMAYRDLVIMFKKPL